MSSSSRLKLDFYREHEKSSKYFSSTHELLRRRSPAQNLHAIIVVSRHEKFLEIKATGSKLAVSWDYIVPSNSK